MTIASQVSYAQAPCNGTTTQFSFNNKIFAASDLIVTLIDPNGVQYPFTGSGSTFSNSTLGLSYTVSNVDVDTGCFITFNSAPANGWTIDGRTNIPEIQATSIKNQGPYAPELHEEFFDRTTRMLQDLLRQTYTFGIHGQDIENTPWPALPLPAARANTNLGFDGLGRLTVSAALAAATLSAAAIGSFLYPVLPAEGASVVNIQVPYGWITRYGAATANADNAVFVRNAYATGLPITIPPGTFFVASPIVPATQGQNTQAFGTLMAALTWVPGSQTPTINNNQNSVNNCIFTMAGSQQSINAYVSPFLDGNFTQSGSGLSTLGTCIADGLQIGNATGGGRISLTGVIIQHFPNFGIGYTSSFAGDSNTENCFVQQWNNADQPWQNQANFTAAGAYYNRADCYIHGITARWCGFPYRFGPASGPCWLRDTHPYNGTYASNPFGAPAQVDPVIIRIDEGASSINIASSYLDEGHIDCYSSDVHFFGGHPLQSISSCVFTQEPGQAAPNMTRMYATGHVLPYDFDMRLATAYLAASNPGGGNSLPTSFIGFYPSAPIAITSLVSAAGVATIQYVATSNFPLQINSTIFLDSVTPSGFNNVVNATATANGNIYKILTVGSTDYTKIGADINAVGHIFMATGAGLGTGTCVAAYVITNSSQSAGGPGVAIVTATFNCAVSATGTGGTLQRWYGGNMNGYTSAGGLLLNGAHLQANAAAGRYFNSTGTGVTPADVLHYNCNFINTLVQCGNQQPSFWGFGNQPGGQPFSTYTTGFHSFRAAPNGGAYQTANGSIYVSFNLTGTSVGDDGSTNGVMGLKTQGNLRISLDGFSGGVQSLYPNTDNYMNLGYTSGGNHRFATVFAATGAINTSDGRLKTDIEDTDLGLSFIMGLRPVKYRWIVGGNHVEHGKYVHAATGEDAPEGYSPTANFAAQDALLDRIMRYPGPRTWVIPKDGGEGHWEGRTEEQESAYRADEAELLRLRREFTNYQLTPEVITPIAGKRVHYGLISQEAKAQLDAHGIKDHAGFVLADPKDANSEQSLRYDELTIPALIRAVQELNDKIKALEAKAGAA